jgi:hypothetical protein
MILGTVTLLLATAFVLVSSAAWPASPSGEATPGASITRYH